MQFFSLSLSLFSSLNILFQNLYSIIMMIAFGWILLDKNKEREI
jgi:hypothetical protein